MVAIVVLLSSFVVAILGFIHSHTAKSGTSGLFGLTRLGAALVLVATVGFAFSVVQQIQMQRAEAEQTRMLKAVHAKTIGEAERASPETARVLREISDQIRAVATRSRESDFAMSDFTESNFAMGRFSRANFEGALFNDANFAGSLFSGANFSDARFPNADFRGEDLGNVLVDEDTVLPSR